MGVYIILLKLGKDAPLAYNRQGFKSEKEAKAYAEADAKSRDLGSNPEWTKETNGDINLFFEGDIMYQVQYHDKAPFPLAPGSESTH